MSNFPLSPVKLKLRFKRNVSLCTALHDSSKSNPSSSALFGFRETFKLSSETLATATKCPQEANMGLMASKTSSTETNSPKQAALMASKTASTETTSPKETESNSHEQAKAMESMADRIIRVTSFVRVDGLIKVLGNNFDPALHDRHLVYDCGHKGFTPCRPRVPKTGLGDLERFPTEMINAILAHLSARDTMRFRGVNRRAMQLINSTLAYKAVTTHAVSCFQAVFRTRMADTVRYADVFCAMCVENCEKCGGAGAYIHLPTLTRCCLRCLHLEPSLRVVKLTEFAKNNKITVPRLRSSVRAVCTNPATPLVGGRRTNYVDYTTAAEAVQKFHASSPSVQWINGGPSNTNNTTLSQSTTGPRRSTDPFRVACPLPIFDKSTWTSYYALSCKGCVVDLSPIYYMDVTTRNAEFTRTSFLKHVEKCPEAHKLWTASEHGRKHINNLDDDLSPTEKGYRGQKYFSHYGRRYDWW